MFCPPLLNLALQPSPPPVSHTPPWQCQGPTAYLTETHACPVRLPLQHRTDPTMEAGRQLLARPSSFLRPTQTPGNKGTDQTGAVQPLPFCHSLATWGAVICRPAKSPANGWKTCKVRLWTRTPRTPQPEWSCGPKMELFQASHGGRHIKGWPQALKPRGVPVAHPTGNGVQERKGTSSVRQQRLGGAGLLEPVLPIREGAAVLT